ncbi:MAG: GspE/PulE family protein [Patescibacteria group bacterium]
MADYISRLEQARAEDAAQKKAEQLKLEYLNLKDAPINTEALKIIPLQKAKQIKALVFDKKIREFSLAAVDPENKQVQDLIKEIEKFGKVKIFVISPISLSRYLENYQLIPKTREAIVGTVSLTKKFIDAFKQAKDPVNLLGSYFSEDFDVSEILAWVLAYALYSDASDLHIEPKKGAETELRYRIDGILYLIAKLPSSLSVKISDRLKLLSQVNLNVRNLPQDGRFTIQLDKTPIEVRFSTIPGPEGENLVMRFLNPKTIGLQLEDLGLRLEDKEILEREIKKPNGLILVTGPTGSGKTTTLYACLKRVATTENKVITLEDPIEYRIPAIEQTQVDSKAGYTFASGLRAILRQDPDVLLVGEIRDQETGEIAMHASLTGHLVFSTLHTNNAAGAIPRLLDFKVKPEIISAALNLIIAQRLVRRLCPKCKKPVQLKPELKNKIREFLNQEAALLKNLDELFQVDQIFEPQGCPACGNKGYKGRIGIFEMVVVDDQMQTLIHANPDEIAIKELAKKSGSIPMMADGLIKILQGITDFNELEKMVGPFR